MNLETITDTPSWYKILLLTGWPGRWGPQGMSTTGGGGLARVPNLRVCEHPLSSGVAHAGREGRINVLPWYRPAGVAVPPVSRTRRESRAAPKRVSGRHVVRRTDSPHLSWKCAQVTGKAGENGQCPGEMCSSPWKRPSVRGSGDTARSGVAIRVSPAQERSDELAPRRSW